MTDEMLFAQAEWLPQYKRAMPAARARFKREPRLGTTRHAFTEFIALLEKVAYIEDWQVVGPFPSPTPGAINLAMPTPVERAFAKLGAGAVDLTATYPAGGSSLAWKPVRARGGIVDLDTHLGRVEWACAYGYAEIDAPRDQEVTFGFGSDDGIKVWLNGKVVHVLEVQRGCAGIADRVKLRLRKGKNRLLVKIDNYILGWSFLAGLMR